MYAAHSDRNARPAHRLLISEAPERIVDRKSFVEPAKRTQRAAEVIERRPKTDSIVLRFGFSRGKLPEDVGCAARRGRDILDPTGLPQEPTKSKDHHREVSLVLRVRGFGANQRFVDRD